MNTSLAIRLNVHENLPRHLRKWHIANGKATFTVDSEFELDVVSFCEDDSDQWHFIDLRLLFSPAPTIAVGTQFQNWFKPQLDGILKEKGLAGCFDFVHNFILTHKIAILKSQAYQLVRGAWAGSIKVEPVHRQLIVQYWTDRPGKKNWIEIGVSSSKPKDGKVSWRGPPIPKLSVRWFREGKEVKDVDLKVDFTNLSMERILKSVISQHTGYFLRTTQNALAPTMLTKVTSSEAEPCDCVLEISLGRPENKATLSVESVTGRYILRPSTAISSRAEQAINQSKDPLTTTASTITQLLAQTLQDAIQRFALQLGWQKVVRQAIHIDAIRKATKLDALQFTLYWPSGWTTKWSLAAIIDASSETWWFVQLGDKGKKIEYAEQLRMEKTGPISPISRATLAGVERLAVQQLEFFVTRRELHQRNLPSAVRTELAVPSGTQILQGWVLQLRTADLLVANSGEDPWLDPLIRITSQGFKNDYRSVSHIASGTMVKSVAADMQKLMAASPQSNFTFSENGNFAILLTTPFGEPIIDELKARLRDVDRLRSFTTTLQKRKMRLRSSSLQQVQFQYSKDLTATVNFGQEKEIKIRFNDTNPHNRIAFFLTEIINEKSPFALPGVERTGLDRFCKTLILTRPLLSTLAELETTIPGNIQNPSVFAHHVGIYRLVYTNPLCSFDIRLKPKDDKVYWHIEDNERKPPDMKPSAERNPRHRRLDSIKMALTALFSSMGPNKTWKGLRSGIVADVDGITDALKTLHQTVVSCSVPEGQLPFQEASPTQQQQSQQQQQQPANSTGQAPQKNALYTNGNTARPGQQAPAGGNRPNFQNAVRQQQQLQMNKQNKEVIELD
jgi:mediator of RNA polymerase II transcription subunit 14